MQALKSRAILARIDGNQIIADKVTLDKDGSSLTSPPRKHGESLDNKTKKGTPKKRRLVEDKENLVPVEYVAVPSGPKLKPGSGSEKRGLSILVDENGNDANHGTESLTSPKDVFPPDGEAPVSPRQDARPITPIHNGLVSSLTDRIQSLENEFKDRQDEIHAPVLEGEDQEQSVQTVLNSALKYLQITKQKAAASRLEKTEAKSEQAPAAATETERRKQVVVPPLKGILKQPQLRGELSSKSPLKKSKVAHGTEKKACAPPLPLPLSSGTTASDSVLSAVPKAMGARVDPRAAKGKHPEAAGPSAKQPRLPSQMTHAEFREHLLDARCKSTRTLLNSLDRAPDLLATVTAGGSLALLHQSKTHGASSGGDTDLGSHPALAGPSFIQRELAHYRNLNLDGQHTHSLSALGMAASARGDVDVEGRDLPLAVAALSSGTAPLRKLGDQQARRSLLDGTAPVLALPELSLLQDKLRTWRQKYAPAPADTAQEGGREGVEDVKEKVMLVQTTDAHELGVIRIASPEPDAL